MAEIVTLKQTDRWIDEHTDTEIPQSTRLVILVMFSQSKYTVFTISNCRKV